MANQVTATYGGLTNSYQVWGHGTSGRWWPAGDRIRSIDAAVEFARKMKADGYGAKIVRGDGKVVVNAPYQDDIVVVE